MSFYSKINFCMLKLCVILYCSVLNTIYNKKQNIVTIKWAEFKFWEFRISVQYNNVRPYLFGHSCFIFSLHISYCLLSVRKCNVTVNKRHKKMKENIKQLFGSLFLNLHVHCLKKQFYIKILVTRFFYKKLCEYTLVIIFCFLIVFISVTYFIFLFVFFIFYIK